MATRRKISDNGPERRNRMRTMVWLKDDLRIEDSPCVIAAMSSVSRNAGDDVVFLRTDEGACSHVAPTRRRMNDERSAIADMRETLRINGIDLLETSPGVEEIMRACAEQNITEVHANIQTSDDLGYRRDRDIAPRMRHAGIRYTEWNADGIRRGKSTTPKPCVTSARDIPGMRFTKVPDAIVRLRRYLERLPEANYRRDMWVPGPDAAASSRMSIDLACGRISADRVLHEITAAANRCDPRDNHVFTQFANRIHWRRGFVQMLEDGVQAFPWGPMRDVRAEDDVRMARWLAGETGYPLVDAAMRDLADGGWINFRLRQTVCSFAIDLLDLDFHKVGVALGELFDDYCAGIHWCQIALQSGMARGRGPRVLNPVKQAEELDPEGAYVRRLLPYLADVPLASISRPWLWTGHRGPEPIVDHMVAARAARARYPASPKKPTTAQ